MKLRFLSCRVTEGLVMAEARQLRDQGREQRSLRSLAEAITCSEVTEQLRNQWLYSLTGLENNQSVVQVNANKALCSVARSSS